MEVMNKKQKRQKTRKSKWPKVNRSNKATVLKRLEILKENNQKDCLLFKQLCDRLNVLG